MHICNQMTISTKGLEDFYRNETISNQSLINLPVIIPGVTYSSCPTLPTDCTGNKPLSLSDPTHRVFSKGNLDTDYFILRNWAYNLQA